ncbi:MAG: hypothetical protein HY959_05135 [Ignavibacteriae bacterium]|nr:hypothetical protein [Ignavibacteriota bacterium]
MKKVFTAIFLLFLLVSTTGAQNLENRMNRFYSDFGLGYSQPLTEALGLMMNNGWVSVKSMKDLFSVDVGISSVFVPVPSSDKTFLMQSPYDQTFQTVPTAVGSSSETPINSGTGRDPSSYPKGFDLGIIPVVMPQASIGNLFATRITIRALPKIKISDLGYISLFGMGIQHSLSEDFVVPMPVDFGIMGSFENLNLGDIASVNAYTVSAVVSKRVWKINFYSLLGYDYSKAKFSYKSTYTPSGQTTPITSVIAFENEGKNGFKMGIGGTAETRFARFNAGMTLVPKFCFDLGMSVGFGLKKLL